MNTTSSYSQASATLYLVPTPIGNFLDMTFRAIETLKMVDYVFAEDTRVTKVLLSHFQITTPLISYHIFNEDERVNDILDLLKKGHNIALVSDAGMPGISDPGYLIANKALKAGYKVISLPGAVAFVTALVASGLPCDQFSFLGFLSHRKNTRQKEFMQLINREETLIFYESPHRMKDFLLDAYSVLGDREIVIARELTKKYEEYIRGSLEEATKLEVEFKGELVIMIKGTKEASLQKDLNDKSIEEHYQYYIDQHIEPKEAMKMVAKDRKTAKSDIYRELQKPSK
ncbi:MAG: 16S rRNA (cytidine(1402)-2'-O)-methyltransferase [Bacilli bacterium]